MEEVGWTRGKNGTGTANQESGCDTGGGKRIYIEVHQCYFTHSLARTLTRARARTTKKTDNDKARRSVSARHVYRGDASSLVTAERNTNKLRWRDRNIGSLNTATKTLRRPRLTQGRGRQFVRQLVDACAPRCITVQHKSRVPSHFHRIISDARVCRRKNGGQNAAVNLRRIHHVF